jgi:hypothetical protein
MTSLPSALVLQLLLAAIAFAAPLADKDLSALEMNPGQQYGTGGGVLGFIVLVLDIIVWSKRKPHCFRDMATNLYVQSRSSNLAARRATSCCGPSWSSSSRSWA